MRFDGQPWAPAVYTEPLCEDYVTDGDKLLQVVDLAWRSSEADEFVLDEWQRTLIRQVLERYPDDHPKYPGELRYKQVVISVGRQNGKSVLGAVFAFYGLVLQTKGPTVVGIAYTKDQADIIFQRVKYVIDSSPLLTKRYKSTNTRGMYSRDTKNPASYVMKAKAEESLQGVSISLCLYDEVHLTKQESWDAVVFGTSARKDAMIIGITTAGDDKSTLLKGLYETGKAAAAQEDGYDERFGFFLWEAPEHLPVTDPEAIKAANPSYACGRLDVESAISAVRKMPEQQARRYRLNQFVASEASWLPLSMWNSLEKAPLPTTRGITFAVDRSIKWEYATITANVKHEGKVYTEVVASYTNPTLETLEKACAALNGRFMGSRFVMEAASLKDLCMRLRERGMQVEYLTQAQMINACSTAYALISERRIVHANDELLSRQVPKGVAKNVGEGWRISKRDSVGAIDSLMATVMGMYAAEIATEEPVMLYVA